jgi:hypothetical protein
MKEEDRKTHHESTKSGKDEKASKVENPKNRGEYWDNRMLE